jgi:DNA-binding response OmpR family regulator/anti-sigma regulatory factor (Ser/Thr protein kinase)
MYKVLIIADEKRLRDNLAEILEIHDYETIIATDGLDGFAKALSVVPDLIICNVTMLNVNGYECLERLKKTDLDYIPLILLSAKIEREDERLYMGLGADDYIKKPFTAAEVLSSVKARIEKSNKSKEIVKRNANKSTYELSKLLNGHEIRTPLNIISGMNILLCDLADENKKQDALQIMKYTQESIYNMTSIINNIYMYELLKTDDEAGLLADYNIVDIVNNIRKVAKEFDRDVTINFDNDYLMYTKYLNAVNYMCVELVYNAIKFTKTESISIDYSMKDNYKTITVKDGGFGFECTPMTLKPFNKFSNRMDISGLGLGLYNIKLIAEKLNGLLQVSSNQDGCMVTVTLPVVY